MSIDGLIDLHGETVTIIRPTKGSEDGYGYGDRSLTMTTVATEKAWILPSWTGRATSPAIQDLAGRLDVGGYVGLFHSDTVLQDNDVIQRAGGEAFEAIKTEAMRLFALVTHVEAFLKIQQEG